MGISVKEVSFVGKIFDDEEEVLKYLANKKAITKEQFADYWEKFQNEYGGLEDIIDSTHIKNFPRIEMIDYCVGEGLFMGYRIETDVRHGVSADSFNDSVAQAINKWKTIFGDDVQLESVTQYI